MKINVKKIKKVWTYNFRLNGKQIRKVASGAITEKQADKIAMNCYLQEFDLMTNPKKESQPEITFADFVENQFLPFSKATKITHDADLRLMKIFTGFFAGKLLSEIRKNDIEEIRRKRMATVTQHGGQRKPATINREINVLSKVFSYAVENELLAFNPCRTVKALRMNNERTRYLTEDEQRRLLDVLKDCPLTKNIVFFAINTGMRRGEIFNLKWFDVDLGRKAVLVRQSKNGKPRTIPMNDEVYAMVHSLPKVSAYVFPSPKTNGRLNNTKRSFEGAIKQAGIENFTFHDLRHTFATRLADKGVPLSVLAELLGHSDIRMTKRYAHATEKAKHEAVQFAFISNQFEQDLSNTA